MNKLLPVNDSNALEWVDRFLAAETTLEEERALYAYFSRTDLPADVIRYQKMFSGYDALGPSPSLHTKGRSKVAIPSLRPWHWVGIAAMIALIFAVGFNLRFNEEYYNSPEYIYAGSYLIRDGRKITDLDIVLPEFEKAEREVEQALVEMNEVLERYDAEADFDEVINQCLPMEESFNNNI